MKICCGCFTVRVGTLVIGILGLIGSCSNLIYSAKEYMMTIGEHDPANQENTEFVKGLFIASMVSASVGLLVNLLLVLGVEQKKKCLMLPWIVFSVIASTLITLAAFFCLISIFTEKGGARSSLLESFIFVLYSVLSWYFTMCVWSHYKHLRDEQARITSGISLPHGTDNNTTASKDTGVPI